MDSVRRTCRRDGAMKVRRAVRHAVRLARLERALLVLEHLLQRARRGVARARTAALLARSTLSLCARVCARSPSTPSSRCTSAAIVCVVVVTCRDE